MTKLKTILKSILLRLTGSHHPADPYDQIWGEGHFVVANAVGCETPLFNATGQ